MYRFGPQRIDIVTLRSNIYSEVEGCTFSDWRLYLFFWKRIQYFFIFRWNTHCEQHFFPPFYTNKERWKYDFNLQGAPGERGQKGDAGQQGNQVKTQINQRTQRVSTFLSSSSGHNILHVSRLWYLIINLIIRVLIRLGSIQL